MIVISFFNQISFKCSSYHCFNRCGVIITLSFVSRKLQPVPELGEDFRLTGSENFQRNSSQRKEMYRNSDQNPLFAEPG